MRAAVTAYLDHVVDGKPEPTAAQLALLIGYCDYWIHAPCWRSLGNLEALRASIKNVRTVEELHTWIDEALEECIDPL